MTREEAAEEILRGGSSVCKACQGTGVSFKGGEPVGGPTPRRMKVLDCHKCEGAGYHYTRIYLEALEVLGLPSPLKPRFDLSGSNELIIEGDGEVQIVDTITVTVNQSKVGRS